MVRNVKTSKAANICSFPLLVGEVEVDANGVPNVLSRRGDVVKVEQNTITTIDTDYDDGETIVKTIGSHKPIKVDMTFEEAVDQFDSVDEKVKGCEFFRSRKLFDGTTKYTPVMLPNVRIITIDISYNDHNTVLVKTLDGRVAVAESFEEAVEEFNVTSPWNQGCVFTRMNKNTPVMLPSMRIKDNGVRYSKKDGTTIVDTMDGTVVVSETLEEALRIYRETMGKNTR